MITVCNWHFLYVITLPTSEKGGQETYIVKLLSSYKRKHSITKGTEQYSHLPEMFFL